MLLVECSGKKNKRGHQQVTALASQTLARASFLCTVLLEDLDNHHLAFRVGLFGLEMIRPPAASKAMEVRRLF